MEIVAENGPARLRVEVEGTGPPVLLLAPGGMRSAAALWARTPWDPRALLRDRFTVVAMDQRNAGGSTAPISRDDGWATYTADQLAVLDHLGIERCQILGMCIGGPFALALLAAAPERFLSAVLLQPAGIEGNRHLFFEAFDDWAGSVAPTHPEATPEDFSALRENLWGGDFLLSVGRDEVRACTTPLLVLMGDDPYHPARLSREIVALARDATHVERWRSGPDLAVARETVRTFLLAHAGRDG